MSYLVLARKYRPKTFSEVVGQEHVTRTLANAFATGRVHHAFLFCGPRGVGKTTLARILGKALNCVNGPTAEPCGECEACVSIANGTAVDYHEMDGASNRGIDSIRELTEAVRYQPAALRKKVYVIDEVHMLTTEAFNALLKTLEEPPPHVTFVLATTEPHKLPNTILSRCQRYDFKLVPAPRLAQHLSRIFTNESISAEPGAVSLIVRESGGSVRDSLSLSDQVISYVGAAPVTEAQVAEVLGVADRALTRRLVSSLAGGDARTALEAAEQASERGVDEVQLARAIVRYLRDLAVLQVAPNGLDLIDASDEERRELADEAQRLDRSRVQQMFERMLRACDDLGKTLQPRLVLDFALIDVATTEPLLPLGDLMQRLGDLERRLGGAPASGGGGQSRPAAPTTTPRPSGPPSRSSAPTTPAPVPMPPAAPPVPMGSPAAQVGSAAAVQMGSGAAQVGSAAAPMGSTTAPMGSTTAPMGSTPAARTAGTTATAPSTASAAAPGTAIATAPAAASANAPVAASATAAGTAAASTSASGAAGAAIPAVPADPLGAWDQVLHALHSHKRTLAGAYEHARVLAWTADAIEIGFSVDWHMFGEIARDTLPEMKTFLKGLLGRPVDLRVKLLDDTESRTVPARSVVESNRDKQFEEKRKRESEAREHPVTKLVLETFGASIKEIKTDV